MQVNGYLSVCLVTKEYSKMCSYHVKVEITIEVEELVKPIARNENKQVMSQNLRYCLPTSPDYCKRM